MGIRVWSCLHQNVRIITFDFSDCLIFPHINIPIIFLKEFIYLIFLERGREREWEGENHQWVAASHVPPIGDLACSPAMCSRLGIELVNPWFTGQCSATEPHQPGQTPWFFTPLALSHKMMTFFSYRTKSHIKIHKHIINFYYILVYGYYGISH